MAQQCCGAGKSKPMWAQTSTILALVAAALSSLAFCDEAASEEDSNQTVWFGKLIVGDGDQLASPKGDVTTPAVYADGYQADQPASSRTDGHRLAELKLQRLSPSVQCDAESMTLRLRGNRLPDFLVDRGEESPVALSQLPDHCGFSVRRGRRDVILVAKYDSCHVSQEANSYILPLHAWGSPVRMACPVSSHPIQVTCTPSEMVVKVRSITDVIKVKVSGEVKPLAQAVTDCGFTLETVSSGWLVKAPLSSSCLRAEDGELLLSLLYMARDLTLSCPEGPAATTSAPAATTSAPATTTSAPATGADSPVVQDVKFPLPNFPQAPLGYPFPYGYGMPWYWPFPPGYGDSMSPTVAPTTTTTPPTTTAPTTTSGDWFPLPWMPGMYDGSGVKQTFQMPHMYFPFSYPVMDPKGPVPVAGASTGFQSAQMPMWQFYPQRPMFGIKSPSVPSGQMAFPPDYSWPMPYFPKY